MKKEKNKINIGEDFIEKDLYEYNAEYKTLRECFDSWSDKKEEVYNKYLKLLNENTDKVERYGIDSYNRNVIVLNAIVKKDNKKYYLYITPCHNWYKEI